MKTPTIFRIPFLFILLLCSSFVILLPSCDDDGVLIEDPPPPPPAPRDQVIEIIINSDHVGETYPVHILIPGEYEENKNLPVVYLLDGLLEFDGETNFEDVTFSMSAIGLNAILVGVGDNTGAARSRDFLAGGCSGGSDDGFNNFYNFITTELVPYIDERYESDHNARTLIGYSHGGNFSYNAFFRGNPEDIIFHNFISGDPSSCQMGVYEAHVDNMNFPADTNLKLYISEAEFSVEELYDLLVAKDFPWLEIQLDEFPNETHYSAFQPTIRKGLSFIYDL
jgi:predicted alpha/beta superfamily hydrolase